MKCIEVTPDMNIPAELHKNVNMKNMFEESLKYTAQINKPIKIHNVIGWTTLTYFHGTL